MEINAWPAVVKSPLILAGALLVCLLPLPYGFYTVIRLAAAVIAGCWAYRFFDRGLTVYAVIALGVVLLFQPFFKIVMDRFTWNVVDVVLAIAILLLVFKSRKSAG